MTGAIRAAGVLAIIAAVAAFAPTIRAASCNGASHSITLAGGGVSPGSGTTEASFTFSVTYQDSAGCPPTSVTVSIDGAGSFSLTGAGIGYDVGVTFSRSMRLPAGSHRYSFSAWSGSGSAPKGVTLEAVNPSSVEVTSPAPSPTPTPAPSSTPAATAGSTPTPGATPKPTRTPTPTPRPSPTPAPASRPSPTPIAGASQVPRPSSGSASPSPSNPPALAAGSTVAPSDPGGSESAGNISPAAVAPSDPAGTGIAEPGGRRAAIWDGAATQPGPEVPASPGSMSVPGVPVGSGSLLLDLLGSFAATIAGVAFFMGLMARRAGRRPSLELADRPPAPDVTERWRVNRPVLPDTPPEEALIPRWRRPSVQAARKAR